MTRGTLADVRPTDVCPPTFLSLEDTFSSCQETIALEDTCIMREVYAGSRVMSRGGTKECPPKWRGSVPGMHTGACTA
jgi:hypothetical protein